MSLVIDSVTYDLPIKVLQRSSEKLYKFAERTVNGRLHSQVIGTYYNYELQIGASINNVDDYADLWYAITAPKTSWEITLPDEDGEVTFDCYFGKITDEVVKVGATANHFRDLTFSVIPISPARTP